MVWGRCSRGWFSSINFQFKRRRFSFWTGRSVRCWRRIHFGFLPWWPSPRVEKCRGWPISGPSFRYFYVGVWRVGREEGEGQLFTITTVIEWAAWWINDVQNQSIMYSIRNYLFYSHLSILFLHLSCRCLLKMTRAWWRPSSQRSPCLRTASKFSTKICANPWRICGR